MFFCINIFHHLSVLMEYYISCLNSENNLFFAYLSTNGIEIAAIHNVLYSVEQSNYNSNKNEINWIPNALNSESFSLYIYCTHQMRKISIQFESFFFHFLFNSCLSIQSIYICNAVCTMHMNRIKWNIKWNEIEQNGNWNSINRQLGNKVSIFDQLHSSNSGFDCSCFFFFFWYLCLTLKPVNSEFNNWNEFYLYVTFV